MEVRSSPGEPTLTQTEPLNLSIFGLQSWWDICRNQKRKKWILLLKEEPARWKSGWYLQKSSWNPFDPLEPNSIKNEMIRPGQCGQVLITLHLKILLQRKAWYYVCQECVGKLMGGKMLEKHVRTKHGRSKKLKNSFFRCQYVRKPTLEKGLSKKHYEGEGTLILPKNMLTFDCNECDKTHQSG